MRAWCLFGLVTLAANCAPASPADGILWPPPWQKYDVQLPAAAKFMELLPGGSQAVAALADNSLAIVDLNTGGVVRQSAPLPDEFRGLAANPARDLVVVAGDKRLHLLRLSDFLLQETVSLDGSIYQIALSPDGSRVAAALYKKGAAFVSLSSPPNVKFWDMTPDSSSYGVGWLPDSRHCVVKGVSKLWVLDVDALQTVASLAEVPHADCRFGLSADRNWVIGFPGMFSFWSVKKIFTQPKGAGPLLPECLLSLPSPFYESLFTDVPFDQWDFAGIRSFDPAHPQPLPIITAEPRETPASVALPDGRIIFSKWNGHLYCWDGKAVAPGNLWSDALPPDHYHSGRDYREAQEPVEKIEILNRGEPFQFGKDRCLARFAAPNHNRTTEMLAPKLDLVDAADSARIIRSLELPLMVGGVEVHPSRDGRFLAVTTGPPGQSFTVPLSELQKNPALMRTAVKIHPSLWVIEAGTDQVITDGVWEKQASSRVFFDARSELLLSFGQTGDSSGTLVLFDLEKRKLLSIESCRFGYEFEAVLLSGGRLVVSAGPGVVALYRFEEGAWQRAGLRTALGSKYRFLLPSPDEKRILLYSSDSPARLISAETLEDDGWLFPSFFEKASVQAYRPVWTDQERIGFQAAETTEFFDLKADLAPPSTVMPAGEGVYLLALSPDGSVLAGALGNSVYLFDYATGRVLNSVAVDPEGSRRIACLDNHVVAVQPHRGGWEAWDLTSIPRHIGAWSDIPSDQEPALGTNGSVIFRSFSRSTERFRLFSGGYNHIMMEDGQQVGTKPRVLVFGANLERWVQIPGEDLMAYPDSGELWLIDILTGQPVWKWSAPGVRTGPIYNASARELITASLIRKWKVPVREALQRK